MEFSPSDDNFNAATSQSENSARELPRLPRETIPVKSISHHETSVLSEQKPIPKPNAALLYIVFAAVSTCLFVGSIAFQMGKRSASTLVVAPITNRVLVAKPIVVHVAGGVKKPGVYTLQSGARIADALQKAGGATKDADTNALNLAALAQDGSKLEVPLKPKAAPRIATKPAPVETLSLTESLSGEKIADIVPSKTELPATSATPEIAEDIPFASKKAAAKKPQSLNAEATSTRSPSSAGNIGAKKRKPKTVSKPRVKKEKSKTIAGLPRALTPSGELSNNASTEFLTKNPLDLNRITREQLEALPDVGPSLAGRILAYRKENGGFKSVVELDNVKGIGEKKLETLLPLLRVEGEINTPAPTVTPAAVEEN